MIRPVKVRANFRPVAVRPAVSPPVCSAESLCAMNLVG